MNPPKKNTGSNSFNEIATLRIELQDTDPVIWRQVEVPTSVTLKVLHDIIQAVMGWLNYHLWEFTIDKQRYGLPTNEDWGTEPRIEASKVRLRDVLKSRKNVIDYLYDFGDSWEHRITVTNIRPAESGVSYPRYIAGEWNAPPEDCGGIPGFYAILEAVADPNHPNHAETKEWLDEYDPKVIDERSIKYSLSRIASRRNAAKARLANNKQTPSTTE
jgi:Plasmid pRiA4b ORF-3-like protein